MKYPFAEQRTCRQAINQPINFRTIVQLSSELGKRTIG